MKESDYYKSGRILKSLEKAALVAVDKNKSLKKYRIIEYEKNPKLCLCCNGALNYEKRKNQYCSSSCSATENNKKREITHETKKKISSALMRPRVCKTCTNNFIPNDTSQKYCSVDCANKNDDYKATTSKRVKTLWANNKDYRDKVSDGVSKAWREHRDSFSCGEKHSNIVGKYTKGKFKGEIESILDVSLRTTRKILKRLKIGCSICGWNVGLCDIHHIHGKKIIDCNNHDNISYICPNCHRLVHEKKINKKDLTPLINFFQING